MSLITCPECGKQVSTEAASCPACGYPVARAIRVAPAETDAPIDPPPAAPTEESETLLREVRPSWWNYGWHLVFCWLIVPWLIALYRRHSFVMRIYPDRVSVEEGFWSTECSEFFIKDIRSIDVRQGIWGKLVGIGDVMISTAATVDAAEEARGVPDPNGVKDLLIARRQRSSTN